MTTTAAWLAHRASEARSGYAEAMLASAPDIIAVIDANAALLCANPAAERMLGWSVEEQQGRTMLELVHPDDLDKVVAAFSDALTSPGLQPPVDYRLRTPSGDWVHLESTANNQLNNPHIAGIIVNAHDVTENVMLAQAVARNQSGLVAALARLSESRDPYTAGHQRQVAELVRSLGQRLGVSARRLHDLAMAAELHDIGKISIPAEILVKPGKLDAVERALVETHARRGHQLLEGLDLPDDVAEVALHHHERLDGSGYPDQLSGAAITEASRIVAVADVVDAITSHRPYRPAIGLEFALDHIESGSGTLYDEDVVSAALAELRPRVQQRRALRHPQATAGSPPPADLVRGRYVR